MYLPERCQNVVYVVALIDWSCQLLSVLSSVKVSNLIKDMLQSVLDRYLVRSIKQMLVMRQKQVVRDVNI